jgi:hypothetical protein
MADWGNTTNEWYVVRFGFTSKCQDYVEQPFKDWEAFTGSPRDAGILDKCLAWMLASAEPSELSECAAPSTSRPSVLHLPLLPLPFLRNRRHHLPLRGYLCLKGTLQASTKSARWLTVVTTFLPDRARTAQAGENHDSDGHVLWRAVMVCLHVSGVDAVAGVGCAELERAHGAQARSEGVDVDAPSSLIALLPPWT